MESVGDDVTYQLRTKKQRTSRGAFVTKYFIEAFVGFRKESRHEIDKAWFDKLKSQPKISLFDFNSVILTPVEHRRKKKRVNLTGSMEILDDADEVLGEGQVPVATAEDFDRVDEEVAIVRDAGDPFHSIGAYRRLALAIGFDNTVPDLAVGYNAMLAFRSGFTWNPPVLNDQAAVLEYFYEKFFPGIDPTDVEKSLTSLYFE